MAKPGFLTNFALVLLHVGEHSTATYKEIAAAVRITERAVQSNLRLLEKGGLISRRKEGRGLRYRVDYQAVLDYQASAPYTVKQLIAQLSALAGQLELARRRRRRSSRR